MRKWLPIESAPRNGTKVECRWIGFGGSQFKGLCIFKKDWYALGKPVQLETWWTGSDFKAPIAGRATHWRPAANA